MSKLIISVTLILATSACVLLLLNGRLSQGEYISPSESFKCKLPGGVLSTQLKISDRKSAIGETVTFTHDSGLLWRIDHLRINKHKLAKFNQVQNRRGQLEEAKQNYFQQHMRSNLDVSEIMWEQYIHVNALEILMLKTYLKWGNTEENREIIFSIDGDYLNIIHHAQNISNKIQKITSSSLDLYKSCMF